MSDDGIQGLNALLNRIGQLATDTRHVERALNVAGEMAVRSIQRNFDEQGRPEHWTPLSSRTLAGRRKGRGKGGPKILIDRGRLRASIAKHVTTDGVRIGTTVVYAARQHFGYKGGKGRGHAKTPARPFLMLQEPEDVVAIGNVFRKHIARLGG